MQLYKSLRDVVIIYGRNYIWNYMVYKGWTLLS